MAELPISTALEEAFARAGLDILSERTAESSLGARRFRWVGGLDSAAAQGVREDLGVDAVMITAIEAYAPGPPPLLSISVRLVSVEAEPRILWAGGFSKTGDDSRGLLGIGAITDPREASAAGRLGAGALALEVLARRLGTRIPLRSSEGLLARGSSIAPRWLRPAAAGRRCCRS